MRITKKRMQTWLGENTVTGNSTIHNDEDSKIYYSKIDGSYITRVGMEDDLKHYIRMGINQIQKNPITNGKTACLGFNQEENKWYGWSHRAIYGFTIGSKTEKGHCGYHPDNKENFAEDCLNFWVDKEYSMGDEKAIFTKGLNWEGDKEVEGVLVTYTYNDVVPNEKSRGTRYENFSQFPDTWGKGEWEANTIEEAKIMAADFASGVS